MLQDPGCPAAVEPGGIAPLPDLPLCPAAADDVRRHLPALSRAPPGLAAGAAITVEEDWAGPAAMLDGQAGRPVSTGEVWEVLREAVGAQMLSDVPLGAFLSGGLDSTAIVALMAELSSQPVRTFSIGFRASGLYDELKYAAGRPAPAHGPQRIRGRSGCRRAASRDHPAPGRTARGCLRHPELSGRQPGAPVRDGGAHRYRRRRTLRRLPALLRRPVGAPVAAGPAGVRRNVLLPALRLVPASGDTAIGDTSRLAQKFLEPLDLGAEQRYIAWNAFFSEEAKQALYAEEWPPAEPRGSHASMIAHLHRVRHRPFPDRAMYLDLKSLSSRRSPLPFGSDDHGELARGAGAVRRSEGHGVRGAGPALAEDSRPEHQGHPAGRCWPGACRRTSSTVPSGGSALPSTSGSAGIWPVWWIASSPPKVLRERGYFRPEYVAWLREQQAAGKRDFSQHLWALIVFELWHRAYLDADLSSREGLTFDDLGLSSGRDRTAIHRMSKMDRMG